MECLQVQRTEKIATSDWNSFYSNISGFEYEPGYIYKIRVKEKKRTEMQLPADESNIEYSLVKILEKNADNRMMLEGYWDLESLNGIFYKNHNNTPNLVIQFLDMEVMGSNGCNQFRGKILRFEDQYLEFDVLARTRKFCVDMRISLQYDKAIQQVRRYRFEKQKLYHLTHITSQ